MLLHLLTVDRPNMIITLLELFSNGGLILNTVLDVLARYRDFKLIKLFLDALLPFVPHHYWIKAIHEKTTKLYFDRAYGYPGHSGPSLLPPSMPVPDNPPRHPSAQHTAPPYHGHTNVDEWLTTDQLDLQTTLLPDTPDFAVSVFPQCTESEMVGETVDIDSFLV